MGDEVVRPTLTAKEAAGVHLLLGRFVDTPELHAALGEDLIESLRDTRRSLHSVLRGAGYVLDDEGWRLADATVQTLLGTGRRR